MAKKLKKKKVKKMKNNQFAKQIARLETDLKYSLKAIDGKSDILDDLFTNQANRIRNEIDKLSKL